MGNLMACPQCINNKKLDEQQPVYNSNYRRSYLQYEQSLQLKEIIRSSQVSSKSNESARSLQLEQIKLIPLQNSNNMEDEDLGNEKNEVNELTSLSQKYQEGTIDYIKDKLRQNLQMLYKSNSLFRVNDFECSYKDRLSKHKLTIYLKSYQITSDTRVIVMKSEWFAPCQPQMAFEILFDYELQKQIDSKVEEYHELENFDMQYQVCYQSVRKIFASVPREFLFIRHYDKVDKENNIWTEFSQSIDHESVRSNPNCIRGNIIKQSYTAFPLCYVQEKKMNSDATQIFYGNEEYTLIRCYQEIDYKINQSMQLLKSPLIQDMINYVDKLYEVINGFKENSNDQEQLPEINQND